MTKPRSPSNRTETLLPTALRAAFEKGVDAGMAAKDAEWRERLRHLLATHTEQFRYGGEKIISVERLEALL